MLSIMLSRTRRDLEGLEDLEEGAGDEERSNLGVCELRVWDEREVGVRFMYLCLDM